MSPAALPHDPVYAEPPESAAGTTARGEPELRRQLDRALGRALVDRSYATMLLAYPLVALGATHRTQPYASELRRINAWSLQDFARQVSLLFWPVCRGLPCESRDGRPRHREPLAIRGLARSRSGDI